MRYTVDPARRDTDMLLRKLEDEIAVVYTDAAADVEAAADRFFQVFEAEDKRYSDMVEKGEMSGEAYALWRRGKLMRGESYRQMRDDLSARIRDAAEIAAAYVNDTIPAVYALNRTYAAYEIERYGVKIGKSWTIYSEDVVRRLIREHPELLPHYPEERILDIPKELRWAREKISSQILRGILAGEPIPAIAGRMVEVVGMDKAAAVRNARTAVTSAECGGRMDTYDAAAAAGIRVQKEWIATHDSRTRHSHGRIDGERVERDGVFSNGCRYPGDPHGAPEEVYNCRCTVAAYLPEYPDSKNRLTYAQWIEKNTVGEQ